MKRKNGIVKNVSNQREKTHYGKCRVLKKYLNGMDEKEYREQWNDNSKLAVLYALFIYGTKDSLFKSDISKIIGYRIRTIKMELDDLSKTALTKNLIQQIVLSKRTNKCWIKYSMLDIFNHMTFEDLKEIYLTSRYANHTSKTKLDPNIPEQRLLDICEELKKNTAYYNGNVLGKKIGKYRPDILFYNKKLILEHNGSPFHQDKLYEEEKIKYFESKGYKVLVIWDYEEKNYEIVKKQIKGFLKNAI